LQPARQGDGVVTLKTFLIAVAAAAALLGAAVVSVPTSGDGLVAPSKVSQRTD
jgi:hypothetical protein